MYRDRPPAYCPLQRAVLCSFGQDKTRGRAARGGAETMSAHRIGRWAWVALLPAALVLMTSARAAETSVSFSLDYEVDGRAAPFLLPFDKGYYKAEGVNVTIAPASGSQETIERVAAGTYEMGLADINALIRFRDANPAPPNQGGFMLYNRPGFAVTARERLGPH